MAITAPAPKKLGSQLPTDTNPVKGLVEAYEANQRAIAQHREVYTDVFDQYDELMLKRDALEGQIKAMVHQTHNPEAVPDKTSVVSRGKLFQVTVTSVRSKDGFDTSKLPAWLLAKTAIAVDTVKVDACLSMLTDQADAANIRATAYKPGEWKTPQVRIERIG